MEQTHIEKVLVIRTNPNLTEQEKTDAIKRLNLVASICKAGELYEYESTVAIGVNVMVDNGILFTLLDHKTNNPKDSIPKHATTDGVKHIFLPVWNMEKGLKFIWDLFHEIGHSMDSVKVNNEPDLEREEYAWNYSEKLLCSFFDQHGHKDAFEDYKEKCLDTYRN